MHASRIRPSTPGILLAGLLAGIAGSANAEAPASAGPANYDTPWAALIGGTPSAHLRLRFENVDDDGRAKEADVVSLRTALGWRTGTWQGLSSFVEMENVVAAGHYDDGGTNRRMTRYAAVIDPEGTELNQGYVAYAGLPGTVLQFGRQLVLDRETPFHRYLGNVVWRQNWQTHDAFSIENKSLPNTRARFWYTYNVNRIFGEDNPTRGLDDKGLNGYLFNVQYSGLKAGTLETYAYLLDFDAPGGFFPSTQTYGARFDGKQPVNPQFDVIYAAEGAWQRDFASNPGNIDAHFLWGTLGGSYRPGGPVQALTVRVDYQLLSGDGGIDRFTTPLATGHAFQGWADQFLNTPGDGIEDLYVSFIAAAWGCKLVTSWHDFSSDNDSYDYGTELDVELSRAFAQRFTGGIKYASYDADRNATNVARNPGQRNDVDKFWVYVQFDY